MLTVVCRIETLRHRTWPALRSRLAFTMARFNMLVQWNGLRVDSAPGQRPESGAAVSRSTRDVVRIGQRRGSPTSYRHHPALWSSRDARSPAGRGAGPSSSLLAADALQRPAARCPRFPTCPQDAASRAPDAAWHGRLLQTQLSAWTQLRHDNLLYAKQSATPYPICEYPAGYVEPYPAFLAALAEYAALGQRLVAKASDLAHAAMAQNSCTQAAD